ncbi:MAG: phage envelope protein [Chitinophagaceae bacterium]|nr:phage envelope protein [Chitinophagaceae bacterium]
MVTLSHIEETSKTARNYPELAQKYADIGIESYTVDVATDIICYRMSDGHLAVKYPMHDPRPVATAFNKEGVVLAIEANIAGKTTYPEFMQAIAQAGVHLYEATLIGGNKRVTYIGITGSHEEKIPSVTL